MSYNRSHLHGRKESKKQASESFVKLEKKSRYKIEEYSCQLQ